MLHLSDLWLQVICKWDRPSRMSVIALLLMAAAGVAYFVPGAEIWCQVLFGAGFVAQIATIYGQVQRWRKAAK